MHTLDDDSSLSSLTHARRTHRWLVILALAALPLIATPARATFHLWQINEVFSNADGTVQYIELSTIFNFQQSLFGETLRVSSTSGTKDFVFGMNSPSPTANQTLLIGTASLENIQVGVIPDFIIDANFIDVIQSIEVSLVGAFTPPLTFVDDLPLDDVHSLGADGLTQVASPRNFAGQVGMVPRAGVRPASGGGAGHALSFPVSARRSTKAGLSPWPIDR